MGGAEIAITVVIIGAIVIAVIAYVLNLKSRQAEAEKMLNESLNQDYNEHYGDYIRADMKNHKWAVPDKLPYGKGAVVTKSTRKYQFSEISSYRISLNDGVFTKTKGNFTTHESILTGKKYGVLTTNTSSQRIATSLIVRVKLEDNKEVKIVIFENKQIYESESRFSNYVRDAKNVGEFLDKLINEHAKVVALEKAAEKARLAEQKAAEKAEKAAAKAAEKAAKKTTTARKPRAKKQAEQETPVAPENSAVSSAEAIKKFKELLDMGAITEEEYEQKKKELLGLN